MAKYEHDGFPPDLEYPPRSGGRSTRIIVGLGLAGYILYFAIRIWLAERACLPARGGGGAWIRGNAARSFAVTWTGGALFVHARWFWGLAPGRYKTFRVLILVGALAAIGGMTAMLGFLFF